MNPSKKEEKIINLSNSLGELETLKSLHDLNIYFSDEEREELEEELMDLEDDLKEIEIEMKYLDQSESGDI